jgi:hypothetical protein
VRDEMMMIMMMMNVIKMNKNDTKELVTVGVIIQYFVIHNTILLPR